MVSHIRKTQQHLSSHGHSAVCCCVPLKSFIFIIHRANNSNITSNTKLVNLREMMTLPNRPGYVVSERRVDTHTSGGNLAEHHDTKTGFPLHQLAHQQSPLHGMLPQDSIGQLAYLPNTNFPLLSSTTKKSPPFSPSPFVGDSLGIVSSSPPPSSPTAPAPSSRLLLSHDPYKSLGLEHLSPEEIHEKKTLLQKHRLQPHMLQIIDYCKKEGIIPTLPPNLIQPNAPTDYSLSEFLELQGIELPEDDYELKNDEFSFKLNQLKVAYNEELEKLNKVCQDFITRMVGLLREQGQVIVHTTLYHFLSRPASNITYLLPLSDSTSCRTRASSKDDPHTEQI